MKNSLFVAKNAIIVNSKRQMQKKTLKPTKRIVKRIMCNLTTKGAYTND